MAAVKSGKECDEERKSSGKMSGEKASGLRCIHKASLTDQCKDKWMAWWDTGDDISWLWWSPALDQ